MMLGTISTYWNNSGVKVTIDGEETQTEKPYLWLAPYLPKVGDRVLIEEVGGQYVILGKVTGSASDSMVTGVSPYGGYNDGALIEFTVYNGNLWVRQNGTQWALAKKE